MPLSIVFQLSSTDRIPEGNLARQAHAWFLRLIHDVVSEDLAAELHQDQELKPFTVSDLIERAFYSPSMNAEVPRSRCALRFTFVDETLAEIILSLLKQKAPKQVEIWWLKLRVDAIAVHSHEHKWAGSVAYPSLANPGNRNNGGGAVLQFVSPTSFHSDGVDMPLPLPAMVFRSCWRKWNAYSGYPIRNEWLDVVDHCIQISRIEDLNTQRWKFADGERGAVTGFVGKVRFSLSEGACKKVGIDPRDAREVLDTLSTFAFYSGIGRKTGWGLGQTRCISGYDGDADGARGAAHAAD